MNGDKVMMLINDGFGRKGWIGEVIQEDAMSDASLVRVHWNNDRSYLHTRSSVVYLNHNPVIEPNLAFLIRKEKYKL